MDASRRVSMVVRSAFVVALGVVVGALGADAALPPLVCYRLPFSNPNLADGWGSTCCGRTGPHRGVDFPQAAGTDIPVAADGTIVVKTSTSCLGNVVVVQHADGMFTGYCHMQAQSLLGVGDHVTKGEHIGRVGATGTCQSGAHLHLTMSNHRDGYFTGTTVDPYAYIMDHRTCDRLPVGELDDVGCDEVTGTALDPDVAEAIIAARVAFGGATGSSDAVEVEVRADAVRAADCAADQPCAHGFVAAVPASLKDDVDHDVYAYGVDAADRTALLTGAPQTLRCAPPVLPAHAPGSVRRPIDDGVLAAWGLSSADVIGARRAEVQALPPSQKVHAPKLVAVDGALFVVDGRVLRAIDDAARASWKLDAASAVVLDTAAAAPLVRGAPWPGVPYLALGVDDDVYAVDAPPPLWATLSASSTGAVLPRAVQAGAVVDASLRMTNRGSTAWSTDVALVPTSPGDARAFCDATWAAVAGDGGGACGVVARVAGVVAPGEATTLDLRLRAPSSPGPRRVCFGLVQGAHSFAEDGQGGPDVADWCFDVLVVEGPAVDDGGKTPAVDGGCASSPTSSSAASSFVLLGVAAGLTRRRREACCGARGRAG